MTDFVSIPLPTVIYDYDVHWPAATDRMGVGSAPSTNGETRDGNVIAAWLNGSGTGTWNIGLMGSQQALCQQLVSTGTTSKAVAIAGFNAYVPLAIGALPAGLLYPGVWRIFRVQALFQLQAAANSGLNCNLVLQPESGVAAGAFDSTSNNTGMGIAGSAASPGTWRYVSRVVAGLPLAESVELGISQTVPTLADFVLLAANGGQPAIFQLYLNGNYSAPTIQRVFGVDPLPSYADPINSAHFRFAFEQADQVNPGVLQVGYLRCMTGHFSPQGQAI